MAAPLRVAHPDRTVLLLGGVLGGILGTSGMILVGLAAERAAGVPPVRWVADLELGFGGPWAGAGTYGPVVALPVHYLHGLILGLVFVGLLAAGERLGWAPALPPAANGLIFGVVLSGFVGVLLWATTPGPATPGLVALVLLMHLTFGGAAGAVVGQLRHPFRPVPSAAVPR